MDVDKISISKSKQKQDSDLLEICFPTNFKKNSTKLRKKEFKEETEKTLEDIRLIFDKDLI